MVEQVPQVNLSVSRDEKMTGGMNCYESACFTASNGMPRVNA